jgi:hypothetical protein
LKAPTLKWGLVDASPEGPTSNGQSVEDLKAGSMGTLENPQNRGNFWPATPPATATTVVHVEPTRTPLVTGGDRSPAWLVKKKKKKTPL